MIRLSHTSATFVIAWEPVDLPQGDAEVIFTIDDTQYERAVTLPSGMSASSRETMVLARDSVSPF